MDRLWILRYEGTGRALENGYPKRDSFFLSFFTESKMILFTFRHAAPCESNDHQRLSTENFLRSGWERIAKKLLIQKKK